MRALRCGIYKNNTLGDCSNDKKSVDFRNWVEEQNSYTENLESGTFEMTGVASKILVIDKAS